MLAETEIITRFIASALIGLILGFTRRHKPAGVRTLALLCLGCTIFTVISISSDSPMTDPTRVIAQVVTGIGFLGLGAIWKYGGKPSGVTTAATVWATAAAGVLIGLGMWLEVAVATILIMAIIYSKEPLVRAHIEDE
ncbi:MAG: MgtC/SapB family protein [Candidatus ainarchaeum sp.]|nr:MgtC/SapB family protein [Candidatus ainarchaeum sp.]